MKKRSNDINVNVSQRTTQSSRKNDVIKINIFERIFYVVIFALVFIMIGEALPRFYYRYIDRRIYYSIENSQKVMTDKLSYSPCEQVVISFYKNSIIDTNANSIVELILFKKNNSDVFDIVRRENFSIPIRKGRHFIIIRKDLPCLVNSGEYFYRGRISFEIEGIVKKTEWQSRHFEIKS